MPRVDAEPNERNGRPRSCSAFVFPTPAPSHRRQRGRLRTSSLELSGETHEDGLA